MSKTPGEYEPRKPISKEVRESRKVLRDADAKSAMIRLLALLKRLIVRLKN